MTHQCPTCGTWIPSPGVKVGGRQRRKIYEYILRHPDCTIEAIIDATYSDDPNGGPSDARNTATAIIHTIRKILTGYGLTIANRRGVGTTYRIVPLAKPGEKKPIQSKETFHGTT